MTRVTLSDALDVAAFRAAVFDLDGVVTRTAELHSAAWKRLFDDYLAERAARTGQPFIAFDGESDYLAHVDGKPRTQGVADFLAARQIELPLGAPDDAPDSETLCGLGNRKNAYFIEALHHQGIELYQSTLALIRRLRAAGLRTALVTSSENGAEMLEQAGISDLFDARVDGRDAIRLGLHGKPHPDVFAAAVQALGVHPSRALAVEDALSGVASAAAAGYGLVIGVDRSGTLGSRLLEHGANLVVPDLALLRVIEPQPLGALPAALPHLERMLAPLDDGREPCLFLDYDGTLVGIADRPDLARLPEAVRQLLRRLATAMPLAIISGRDREDLARLVDLPELIYAGSHGLDIIGPDGLCWQHPDALAVVPALDRAQRQLAQALCEVPGVLIERKRFALAVHFRLVAPEAVDRVRMAAADALRRGASSLRLTGGKAVVELRPSLPWDKGSAVHWMLQRMARGDRPWPLYLGDDDTDEDAFRVMPRIAGAGICVGSAGRRTCADWRLDSPDEVVELLAALARRGPASAGAGAPAG